MNICKHFGDCGGCSFQDIAYKDQLKQKEDKIKDLLLTHDITTQLKSINHYQQWFYRNKVEFTFSDDEGIACGLHSKLHKRKVVDIEQCLIFSPDTGRILAAIKEFAKKKELSVYSKFSHKGFLRHLILRHAKNTNQLMVGIVTSSEQALQRQEFIECLRSLRLEAKLESIYWVINDSLSDAVVFEKKELIYGEPFIQEKLNGLVFNINIDSFFQVNSKGIADLYNKIADYTHINAERSVLDLYCGVGCIGISLAKKAKFVWGVELGEEIVKAAWENAKINNIENISFFASDVRKFLNCGGSFHKDADLVTINPPRSGLSKKVIRAVLRLKPKEIVYSSCNPTSFFNDAKGFMEDYDLKIIEPFDFFAHTPHMEVLGIFKRKDSF